MELMCTRTMDMVAHLQDAVSTATVQAAQDRAAAAATAAAVSQASINNEVKSMLLTIMSKLQVDVPGTTPSATTGELSVDASVYPDNVADADDDASDVPHGYQLVNRGRTVIPGPYSN